MRRRSFELDDGRTRGAEMPPPIALARMPRSSAEGPDAIRLGRQEKLPLSLIVGLTAEAELDLKKIGIDDVEDLAAANPILLLTDTSYAFAQIVDWIGEALLLHYFGSDQAGQLRRFGVRTILNLLVACDGRPAAAMARILCRSDDPVALSSLAATLQADPLVTRLSELQNPNASRIVGTIIEAGAAARRLARAGHSRLASYDHLLAARDEAYAGLSLRERLHAAHRAVLVAAVLAIFGALAAIWLFGGAAPGGIAGPALPSLLRNGTVLLCGAVATVVLIVLLIALHSAFTARRASHNSYVRLTHFLIFIAGVLIGTTIWLALGDAASPWAARVASAARPETPKTAAVAMIEPTVVEDAETPKIAEPIVTADAVTAPADGDSTVGETVTDAPAPIVEPQQRGEAKPPPAAIATADPPATFAEAAIDEGAGPAARPTDAAVTIAQPVLDAPAIERKAAPAAETRRVPPPQGDGKRYFVQFGTYHLRASAESDCPAFSRLGPVAIVPSRVSEIGFYCRTATSRDHDAALSLLREARATMNREAMLVADSRPID